MTLFFLFSSRFTTPSTRSAPAVPTNWASRPIRGCGSWSSRTWTATASGGWARRRAGEATCPPTTSANPNTHEQRGCCRGDDNWDSTWSHSESRQNKSDRTSIWFILDLLSWSLIVRRTDLLLTLLLKVSIICLIFILTVFFYLLEPAPSHSSKKKPVNCTRFCFFAISSAADDNELYVWASRLFFSLAYLGDLQWKYEGFGFRLLLVDKQWSDMHTDWPGHCVKDFSSSCGSLLFNKAEALNDDYPLVASLKCLWSVVWNDHLDNLNQDQGRGWCLRNTVYKFSPPAFSINVKPGWHCVNRWWPCFYLLEEINDQGERFLHTLPVIFYIGLYSENMILHPL